MRFNVSVSIISYKHSHLGYCSSNTLLMIVCLIDSSQ
jgi:hypothetical protein